MEQFLVEFGLGSSVATFQEHNVRLEQIGNLLTDEIKELLPRVGDRETFRKAVERKRIEEESSSKRQERCLKRKRVEDTEDSCEAFETPEMPVRGQQKLDLIVKVLKQDEAVKVDLINKARAVVTPYLFEENRRDGSGWEMIDFELGKLNCPLCSTQIVPQYRKNSYFDWIVENYDRHLKKKHVAVEYLVYQDEASTGRGHINLLPREQDSVNDDAIGGEMDGIDNGNVVDNGDANVVQNDDGNDAQNVKPNGDKAVVCDETVVGDAVVTQKVNYNGDEAVVRNDNRNDDVHNDDSVVLRNGEANVIQNVTDDQNGDVNFKNDAQNVNVNVAQNNFVQNGDASVPQNVVHNGDTAVVENGDVDVVQNVGGNDVQNNIANVAQNENANIAQDADDQSDDVNIVQNGDANVQNDGENDAQNEDVNVAQNDFVQNGHANVPQNVQNGDAAAVQNVGGNVVQNNVANVAQNVNVNIAQEDWQQPGARFGWIQFNKRECSFPGFLYEDNLAQWMIRGGQLSDYKRPYEVFETNIPNGRKKKKIDNLIRFNARNGTTYQ